MTVRITKLPDCTRHQDNFAQFLVEYDLVQARRFKSLGEPAREIAEKGIRRYLRACARMDVIIDVAGLREIIDDAQIGRLIYTEPTDFRDGKQ